MTTYPDSVRFLYALGNEIKTAKLGLGPMRAVMSALGDQQRRYRIIHVAGTNGKGSTCAMIEAGLRAAGYKTGLYTSPHLVEPTERIRINGIPVSPEQFQRAFDTVHVAAERLVELGILSQHTTYFETITAMAFLLFAEAEIDILVCETGLGGRLDATNIVDPELSVITSIDFDHEMYLGTTISAIAGEKAGIIKPGVPVLCAPQRHQTAEDVIAARAAERHSPLTRLGGWAIQELTVTAEGCQYLADGRLRVVCPLAGRHQVDNSLTAAAALQVFGVSPEGIARTVWPGRLERVPGTQEIILDGAHNPAGAQTLANYIEEYYKGRPVWLIFGAMRDKAIEEIGGLLFPLASHIILTSPDSQRATHPESLRQSFPEHSIEVARDVSEAVQMAKNAPLDAILFITGSLFLVGEARRVLVCNELKRNG